MSIYHDEVEIEDMEYDEETETYYYPCSCGDRFAITKVSLDVDFRPGILSRWVFRHFNIFLGRS